MTTKPGTRPAPTRSTAKLRTGVKAGLIDGDQGRDNSFGKH